MASLLLRFPVLAALSLMWAPRCASLLSRIALPSARRLLSFDALKRGDAVSAEVQYIGHLGASVKLIPEHEGYLARQVESDIDGSLEDGLLALEGMIFTDELTLFEGTQNGRVIEGDVLMAYVQHVRDDGKIDVVLRPPGMAAKIEASRDIILAAIEEAEGGTLPIGDKSNPEEIKKIFPGMSKKQFKGTIGTLFREGIVKPSPQSVTLIPEGEREGPPKKSASITQPNVAVVKGLPFSSTEEEVRAFFASCGTILKVSGMKQVDGRASGIAFITFEESLSADKSLGLTGTNLGGRTLTVDRYSDPKSPKAGGAQETGQRPSRPRGGSWATQRKSAAAAASRGGNSRTEDESRTIFCGNLKFGLSDDVLRGELEAICGESSVEEVRFSEHGDYAHVRLSSLSAAEVAVREMNQVDISGRRMRVDFVGARSKRRPSPKR